MGVKREDTRLDSDFKGSNYDWYLNQKNNRNENLPKRTKKQQEEAMKRLGTAKRRSSKKGDSAEVEAEAENAEKPVDGTADGSIARSTKKGPKSLQTRPNFQVMTPIAIMNAGAGPQIEKLAERPLIS